VSDDSEQVKRVMARLPPEWDAAPYSFAEEIAGFLRSVKDEGTSIDSGTDGASGDLWVTVQGVEYLIVVRKSHAQSLKEGKSIP
jgi:hypothetical protein